MKKIYSMLDYFLLNRVLTALLPTWLNSDKLCNPSTALAQCEWKHMKTLDEYPALALL